MNYEPYATVADYLSLGGGEIPPEKIEERLRHASRQIDTLTYNRIVATKFENLTEFQQGIIKESCCLLADFLYENGDLLNSALNSYSVNGVSMSFGGVTVDIINSVPIRKDIYALLAQSGLCTTNLHWRRTICDIQI